MKNIKRQHGNRKSNQVLNAAWAATLAVPLAFGSLSAANAASAASAEEPITTPTHMTEMVQNTETVILAQATPTGITGETGEATPSLTMPLSSIQTPSTEPNANQSFVMMDQDNLQVGHVTFTEPWMLLGFLSFPLLWMLMRSTPPTPRREGFPAIRLLFNLKSQDQEPAEMPLWQRLLRLTLAGTVIMAMADPEFNRAQMLEGDEGTAIVILVDNGWASAPHWEDRQEQLQQLIDQAGDENRPVAIIMGAMPQNGGSLLLTPPVSAQDAKTLATSIESVPWPVNRESASDILDEMQANGILSGANVVWLSNGLSNDADADAAFVQDLQDIGPTQILVPEDAGATYLLSQPRFNEELLQVDVQRAQALGDNDEPQSIALTAYDDQGRPLAQESVSFGAREDVATVTFSLPLEVRNIVSRVSIDEMPHAAATILLDERWRIRPVGVLEVPAGQESAALLRGDNYITEALRTQTDVSLGGAQDILANDQSVIIRPDASSLTDGELQELQKWVEEGGTLVRFAGPRLAASLKQDSGASDPLLPVPMRENLRIMDENFSGAAPQSISEFEENSPFHGITVNQDVRVSKAVTADPSADLDQHVWARLADGSPLVTARQMDEGWTVLIHTTSNTEWSDLVLSGTFVEMMQAIVSHSNGAENGLRATPQGLEPYRGLNTQGRLQQPFPAAQSLTQDVVDAQDMSAIHPAGYYGSTEFRYAYNISDATDSFAKLEFPDGLQNVKIDSYQATFEQKDLKGLLLSATFMLAIADMGIMLGQRRALPFQGRRRRKLSPEKPKVKIG